MVIGLILGGLALCVIGTVKAGAVQSQARRKRSDLEEWVAGKGATGNWFGERGTIEEFGITFSGGWKGTFFGLTSGGLDAPHGAFDEEITLAVTLDFGRLAGIEGLTAQGAVRWRDGRDPNCYIEASSTFGPSKYRSGLGWRLLPFTLTYTTPELFGVKDFLTISGGWQNAYSIFADQPLSRFFINNSIAATKGLGGLNGFPWSSSYAAWGGYLKVRPADWHYTMAGLYLAIPDGAATENHGFDLAGFARDPSRNGLFFVAETGVTPKIGPAKLPGKYAFGTLYWGVENASFCGGESDGKFAFYWQAEQMLFREKEGADEGLSVFSFLTYAPPANNALLFYFHTGLVYKGLIPGRERDRIGAAFSFGSFSRDKWIAEDAEGIGRHQSYEGVVEVDYGVQLTEFLSVQPFWQYVIRPGGRGTIGNANLFGIHMEVDF